MKYQNYVTGIINYLKENKVCKSSIISRQECYEAFGLFLRQSNTAYSLKSRDEWFVEIRELCSRQKCFFWKQYIYQLEEFIQTGTVSKQRFSQIKSTYSKLPASLRQALDLYLDDCSSRYTANSRRLNKVNCSMFLIELADIGITEVELINYSSVCYFTETNLFCSPSHRQELNQYASRLLDYWGNKGLCDSNLTFLLDSNVYPYIGNLDFFPAESKAEINRLRSISQEFPSDEFRASIPDFVNTLSKHGYVGTTISLSKQALTALFLFLHFHDLGFHSEIMWLWFEEIRKSIGNSWLHWRRILCLYQEYTEIGDILPRKRFNFKPTEFDLLPVWCKKSISQFIDQKTREHKTEGSIRGYRCSASVFCHYLIQSEINCFEDLTIEIIKSFIEQDRHSSFDGRCSRLAHLRGFLRFLFSSGYTGKTDFSKCILSGQAPETKIIDVLTDEQIKKIEEYRSSHLSPIELRDIAIVLLGLKMGLRASDVLQLRLSDIDWKNRVITIVMHKTKVGIYLPMPVDVGNAIYKYLREGRPVSSDDHIFLSSKAPNKMLTSKICAKALWRILPERKAMGGFHVTRRTFATKLLQNNTDIDTIIDSLGHTDPTSVMKYLSLDEERMAECPLSLKETGLLLEGVFS